MTTDFFPREQQPQMIDWCLSRPVSGLFALPGKGKTGVTLKVLDQWMTEGSSRGALLIAPIRVCSITWPNQIEKWTHSAWMKFAHLRTPEGLQAWKDGSADIYLVNPEQLASYEVKRICQTCRVKCAACKGRGKIEGKTCEACKGMKSVNQPGKASKDCEKCKGKWMQKTSRVGLSEKLFKGQKTIPVDTFIWDELSLACNPENKSVESLRPYLPMFKQRLSLTGTPVPNDYRDLFAETRLMDDGARFGVSSHRFRQIYFEQDRWSPYVYTIRPGAKEKIEEKISDIFLVVKEDSDNLPAACIHDVEIDLPSGARKQYALLEKQLLLEISKPGALKGQIVGTSAATLSIKLRQIVSGSVYDEKRNVHRIHDAKIEALKKLRKKHAKEPMLVITEFMHEMDWILQEIPGAKRFHEKDMDAWQRGEISLWVSHKKSLSHGIDGLQTSSRILVWFTLGHSNQSYVQTNKRIHRPGQTLETIIYRILWPNSIEDAVVESLKEKDEGERGLLAALNNLQRMRKLTPL